MEIEAVGPIGSISSPAGAATPEQQLACGGMQSGQTEERSHPQRRGGSSGASLAPPNAYSRFILDQSNRVVAVQVVDAESGEVLREIPPDAVAQAARLSGGLVNVRR